jgi:hypothetical protein
MQLCLYKPVVPVPQTESSQGGSWIHASRRAFVDSFLLTGQQVGETDIQYVRPIGKALISGRSVSCSDYVACCCGTSSSSSSSNVLIVELRDNGFGLKLGTIYTRI